MIKGIGTDIVEITRIKKIVDKNSRFLSRNFTKAENDYFNTKKKPYESIAGNFAAKEAISKALGTGFSGFGLLDIEVTRNNKGAPTVTLYNKALDIKKSNNISQILVTISHCEKYAVAFATAE